MLQETLYIGQWCLRLLQSRHLGTSQFSQSPSAALSYFSESHGQSEISSLSKVILVLGKARSCMVLYLGCRGCWVTWVIWCFTNKLHKTWCMSRAVVVMRLPITSCPQLQLFSLYCISLNQQKTLKCYKWERDLKRFLPLPYFLSSRQYFKWETNMYGGNEMATLLMKHTWAQNCKQAPN